MTCYINIFLASVIRHTPFVTLDRNHPKQTKMSNLENQSKKKKKIEKENHNVLEVKSLKRLLKTHPYL